MTQQSFVGQMARLKNYFGEENYPKIKQQLIWDQVKDLPDHSFFRIVNFFIGERSPDFPPQVSHFTEQAARERQASFTRAVKEAGFQIIKTEPRGTDGLKKALDEMGVESLMDAILKRRNSGVK